MTEENRGSREIAKVNSSFICSNRMDGKKQRE